MRSGTFLSMLKLVSPRRSQSGVRRFGRQRRRAWFERKEVLKAGPRSHSGMLMERESSGGGLCRLKSTLWTRSRGLFVRGSTNNEKLTCSYRHGDLIDVLPADTKVYSTSSNVRLEHCRSSFSTTVLQPQLSYDADTNWWVYVQINAFRTKTACSKPPRTFSKAYGCILPFWAKRMTSSSLSNESDTETGRGPFPNLLIRSSNTRTGVDVSY